MKLDVQPFIDSLRESLDLTEKKRLLIIQVGDNPASNLYIKSKLKEADKWNVECHVSKFDETITEEKLGAYIMTQGLRDWNGIIVQLPLPRHINEQAIVNCIPRTLNVDGFDQNDGHLPLYTPCTALGIVEYLRSITDLEGKNIVLIGRGKTVGKPLIPLLLNENATLTICHSHTKYFDLRKHLTNADIVISAIGKPEYIVPIYNKKGLVIIDAGISRVNDKQVGDFSHKYIPDNIDYTPWTGGVGKLTVAMLMYNVRKEV